MAAAGVTVEQLWRAVFPQASSLGTSESLSRSVAWVRVLKARTPAFDALDADDLAIVPVPALAGLASYGVDATFVVEAVSAAGGSGVIVLGDANEAPATAVLSGAARRGLAALALAEADINALERSAISFVVNARAELDARAAELERDLEQAALAGAGADGLAAVMSRFFARPVAIEADDGRVLAVHAGAELTAAAPAVSAYLRRGRGAALRTPLPVAGALVLLGPAPVSDLERVASARVAGFLALSLAATATGSGADGPVSERMPSDGPPWRVMVCRQLDADDRPQIAQREALRTSLRQLEPARRLQLRGDATSLELRMVAAPPDDRGAVELAARVSLCTGRTVALSEAFATGAERARNEAAARTTLEAFESLPPSERTLLARHDGAVVVRAELLPALRLIGGLASLPDAARHAKSLLRPLLNGRRARDEQALATLRAVLDHAGLAEAAAALGIHRNTLAYRLAVIERRSGFELSDPLVRFGLGLALRIVQNDQIGAG